MKQKKYVSRREKTLRRLKALLLLFALFVVSGVYGILPGHALRAAEEWVDCGPTTVIQKLGSAKIRFDGLNRMYVSANRKAVLFTSAQFSLLEGWQTGSPGAVDCAKDRPLHAGIYAAMSEWEVERDLSELDGLDFDSEEYGEKLTQIITDSYKFDRVFYAYGRVDDHSAALVRILVGYEGEEGWVTLRSGNIPRDRWIRSEGHIYFVEEIFRGSWIVEDTDYEGRLTYRAELLDEEGKILYLDEELVSAATRLSPVPCPKV